MRRPIHERGPVPPHRRPHEEPSHGELMEMVELMNEKLDRVLEAIK